MRPFRVVFHRRARSELRRQPRHIINRVYELAASLVADPVPHDSYDIEKMSGEEEVYRVRFGDIRVVYQVDWKVREVTILRIASRGRVYDS